MKVISYFLFVLVILTLHGKILHLLHLFFFINFFFLKKGTHAARVIMPNMDISMELNNAFPGDVFLISSGTHRIIKIKTKSTNNV